MLKKAFVVIIVLMLFTVSGVLAATGTTKKKKPYITKTIEVPTKDSHLMKAKLIYPRTPKGVKGKVYPTIIMLHSLGYSSTQWGSIPQEFVKQGYAVLLVDLRGHGLSNKDVKFRLKSWTYFTPVTYKKYPSDVIAVINQIKKMTKKVSFNDYVIIGGDIGANTGVLVAQKMYPKPKAMVLLTPSSDMKGLKIFESSGPIPLAQVGNCPILVMCSKGDNYAVRQELLLKNFAKGTYIINNTDLALNGMLILNGDTKCKQKVFQFVHQNLPVKK